MQREPQPERPLKVVLLTDVFPPGSGGSGWSTYFLGKALQERGHGVYAIRPRYGGAVAMVQRSVVEYGGMLVEELLIPSAPRWLAGQAMARAWEERTARRALARRAESLVIRKGANVLHGQHAVSALAAQDASRGARRMGARVVSVATVRDYWPLCPVSTRLVDSDSAVECQDCHRLTTYLACGVSGSPRPSGTVTALAPGMARWLRTWAASRALARCDAVIAVSEYVRSELARSGRVPEGRLASIPNLVHLPSVDRALSSPWPLHDISPEEPFLLFAGKLDTNKGVRLLPLALERARVGLPLVLAGDGPLKGWLEEQARERRLDVHFCDWLDNDAVLRLMHQARALLFPSAWQEPLSRVLLEGCAAGAAIVALDTGGTLDIIEHRESGWLARGMGDFAEGIQRVCYDDDLNRQLRAGARRRAEERFAAPVVSARVERLYRKLLARAEAA